MWGIYRPEESSASRRWGRAAPSRPRAWARFAQRRGRGRRGVTVLALRPEWCMPALFPFDVHIIFLRLKYMGFVIFHLLKN